MEDEADFTKLRNRMVTEQIVSRGIHDERLLDALRQLPRHWFVPEEYAHIAYTDGPLPIGRGQTISQPYIVALMTELLGLQGDENVLEVGTGSGYQSALLALLARQVHTIERHASLAENAINVMEKLHITNVIIHIGDGSLGLPDYAPYQAIMVTAAAPRVPQPLFDQLDESGCLVIPEGGPGGQMLDCWHKEQGDLIQEHIAPVAFVPLRGKHGWKENNWGIF
ncbi:MAG: protein-L-isoaspartate O-methyltransferase [Anaerolineales bacterium]|nr:protein-L-isoaspartate(D-aspartate) O-methyltransferase [Anaerolineae bacterium]PWB56439.1 MAG: protein-L-isoaspartate O-methyltransferase [Anaerolineales bacterium]